MSIWRLMAWQLMGSGEKSSAETTRLVHNVLLTEDFNLEDISEFNAETATRSMDRLEATLSSDSKSISQQDGWKTDVNVNIQVPSCEKCSEGKERVFMVCGLTYCPLISVVRAAFMEAALKQFHLTPFKHIWKSPVTGREQQLYNELYMSDIWIKAHDDVQKQCQEDSCTLNTHLAQFGHATAWPVYLFFGNLSKYEHASASPGPCHPLPESLTDFINSFMMTRNHLDVLVHCKCELCHAVWKTLLDDEFVEAYGSGIITRCHGGVLHHMYPQIFTYSADYPEKIILVTIHDKGLCPCPRCCLPKSSFSHLGFASDHMGQLTCAQVYARSKICAVRCTIYQFGNPVKGTAVERILKDCSLVPTLNSFAEHLSLFHINIYLTLIVDLMHKFELGILKSVLKHLIRILYAIDPSLVSTLNKQFFVILPFGVDGICHFLLNVAEMRQWVARHFKDMLQCLIPTFKGLLPAEHDAIVKRLLFHLSEWHTLTKLQMYLDDSLAQLNQALKRLAAEIRRFQWTTCEAFKTHELPSEIAAQHRRQQSQSKSEFLNNPPSSAAHPKSFNTLTYKFHGKLVHCVIKKFYRHMNRRDVTTGLMKQERWQMHIQRQLGDHTSQEIIPNIVSPHKIESSPELHHIMHALPCNTFNLTSFLRENRSDPTVKMKDHLLSQLYGYEYDGDEHSFTDDEHNDLQIISVNYTTYDIHHKQDVMQPGPGCFVMTLSWEDGPNMHPFWYAQVLQVLHINVLHIGPNARCHSLQHMELLWVHWLGVEPQYSWGFQEAQLPKVEGDYNAFGFLDPSFVIHGCHLIPSFSNGQTMALLQWGASVARHPTDNDDWCSFYVNMFADHDMLCHFTAIGVGHKVQYLMQMTSSAHDGGDEPASDDDDSCASTSCWNINCP
ncbi:hypothetical protein EDD16DRAFT_1693060 [Pisolithus croceorrhizus]|nr:hypothetical protein EDD16DRAFT_1693060 [Pisolithus croceorrhizus]